MSLKFMYIIIKFHAESVLYLDLYTAKSIMSSFKPPFRETSWQLCRGSNGICTRPSKLEMRTSTGITHLRQVLLATFVLFLQYSRKRRKFYETLLETFQEKWPEKSKNSALNDKNSRLC